MESEAKALGHPIHQMLIPFPFGLPATAVVQPALALSFAGFTLAGLTGWLGGEVVDATRIPLGKPERPPGGPGGLSEIWLRR